MWHVLIHSIPPRPLYLRAKVRQRLERLGAVALKNSVYVLPESDDALEDFQWLAGEITAGGGQAFIVAGRLLGGATDEELIATFRSARTSEYEAFLDELRAVVRKPNQGIEAALARLRRRLGEIRAIDYFDAPKGKEAEQMLARLERKQPKPRRVVAKGPHPNGATWVTRRGIKIDRIASSWLVRRFIDPGARFRFIDPESGKPKKGEIAFDMAGGDYTHEGDRCTFETIAAAFRLRDAALRKIAEIVHDIDLKDDKYSRPETAGIRQVVEGILAAHPGDDARLERGFAVFDDLYASFRR